MALFEHSHAVKKDDTECKSLANKGNSNKRKIKELGRILQNKRNWSTFMGR